MTALYSFESAPSATPAAESYGVASPNVGSCNNPKLNQKTVSAPKAIMGKKLPMIHSKIVANNSRRGPVKKKIPLTGVNT